MMKSNARMKKKKKKFSERNVMLTIDANYRDQKSKEKPNGMMFR